MAIMAGIDLLAKFYFTDHEKKGTSRTRFIKFVELYIDKENSEVIYQLRNSLIHSFGLYSKDKRGKEFKFILNRRYPYLVTQRPDTPKDFYIINIHLLHYYFEKSIDLYKTDLESNDELIENFAESFLKYGKMFAG
jgi:hypothetical protein